MPYVPHTPEDREEMLRAIGQGSMDDLFRSIPEALRLRRPLKIPGLRTEAEILRELDRLAAKNARMDCRPSFLGAGVYHRFIPAAADYLAGRGEFNTAYTPYQPEVSQGTLQAIFEYQTLICRLTGMEITNASMYEAASALAEAVLMAHSVRGGSRVVVSEGIHPEYLQVLRTYLANHAIEVKTLALEDGVTPPGALEEALSPGETITFAFQNPNFFGFVEDGPGLRRVLQERPEEAKPLLIVVHDPIALALLAPPGSYGADIVLGDGQALGNYPMYGGPTFSFFATRAAHVRKLPGRIVGQTSDRDGKRGYVLTFQTREQHIRRERATSNICTNQGLCALRAAMYLSLLGESGLREVAEASVRKAHHAFARLSAIAGVKPVAAAPFFNEFPLRLPLSAGHAYHLLGEAGIGGGLPLGRYFPERQNEMLFAVTEMTRLNDIERLAEALGRICAQASLKAPVPARRTVEA